MTKLFKGIMAAVVLTVLISGLVSAETQLQQPKNVIYFICDGLGPGSLALIRYHLQSENDQFSYELFTDDGGVLGLMWTNPEGKLVTDSAAAGTALACGSRTTNGYIGTDSSGTSLKSILKIFKEHGFLTGLISNTRITHATPAAFYANIDPAKVESPRWAENQIADQLLGAGFDLVLGGGIRHFLPENAKAGDFPKILPDLVRSSRKDNQNLIDHFKAEGYRFIHRLDEIPGVLENFVPGRDRILGLFDVSHLRYEIDSSEFQYSPSIEDLVKLGLDALSERDQPFFLVVESGRIDHACHDIDPGTLLQELIVTDRALKQIRLFLQENPDTLLVLLSDHDTASVGFSYRLEDGDVIYPDQEKLNNVQRQNRSFNRASYRFRDKTNEEIATDYREQLGIKLDEVEVQNLRDTTIPPGGKFFSQSWDGANDMMTLSHNSWVHYGVTWGSAHHSSTPIPIVAVGPAAEKFSGFKDITEISSTILGAFGLTH